MPHSLTRRSFLETGLAATLLSCRSGSGWKGGGVAFSLRQAESLMRAGKQIAELTSLGGITEIFGLVHDKATNDAVLVGRRQDGAASLSLDELATAVQARIVRQEWPLVSIDKVADTQRTGLQQIRWEGGVAETSFGAKLLAADEFLKNAALGLAPSTGLPFKPYFDLCAESAASGQMTACSSRFWFHTADATLLAREHVFILEGLRIGVRSIRVAGASQNDVLADRYAAAFSANFDSVAQRRAEVAALEPLFDAVAVAHGMESLPADIVDFWAHRYKPVRAHTPSQCRLIRRQKQVNAGSAVLELNGGVDTRVFVQRLRDRDHIAFQEAVLKTRPAAETLSWSVPLSAWAGQAEVTPSEHKLLSAVAGTTIDRRLLGASPPSINRGGVYADVPVSHEDIKGRK